MLLVTGALVWVNLGIPVIHRQARIGLGGKQFLIYKFRSMTNSRDPNGDLQEDVYRLTRFGKFLRKWSIDEFPQLYNVLRGEMSLVGPRALPVEYRYLYSRAQFRRHEVRPGITGWAQVNGRNGISWEEKFRLDVWYVDHQSFWLDLKILFLTVYVVLSRKGVSAGGEATMPKFRGSVEE